MDGSVEGTGQEMQQAKGDTAGDIRLPGVAAGVGCDGHSTSASAG